MIRSILQLGGRGEDPGATRSGSNLRRAGRIVCANTCCSWGEVLNASASGMRILARTKLVPPVNTVSVLTIQGPDHAFQVSARVVWSKKRNWGKQELGVQFVEVPPESRAQLARLAEMAGRDITMDGLDVDGFRRSA